MATTSLISHADLQRRIAELDGDSETGTTGILVGLAAESGVAEVLEQDGEVSVVIDGGAVFKLQAVNLDVGLQAEMRWAILPHTGQENLRQSATDLLNSLKATGGSADAEAALADAIDDVAATIAYNEHLTNVTGGVGVGRTDRNDDGEEEVVVGFGAPYCEGRVRVAPLVGFAGGDRVATGDFDGDGAQKAKVTLSGGEQFVLADGAARFMCDGVETEIWSTAEGSAFSDGKPAGFEDSGEAVEVCFTAEASDGIDWLTAADGLFH